MNTPSLQLSRVISSLALSDCQPHRSGAGYAARCPAHEDRNPSLTLADGRGGVVLTCHAGCPAEVVVERLGLSMNDLFYDSPVASVAAPSLPSVQRAPKRNPSSASLSRPVGSWTYHDEHGAALFRVERFDREGGGKDFSQSRWSDVRGRFVPGMTGDDGRRVSRVLYRLPEVMEATGKGRVVFVAEGEKCADAVAALCGPDGRGLVATTQPGGAGKWRGADEAAFVDALAGAACVVVLADNDETGRKHAADVARSVVASGIPVRLVRLPGLGPKGDVADWLAAGRTAAELLDEVRNAPLLRTASEVEAALTGAPRRGDADEAEDHSEADEAQGEGSLAYEPFPVLLLPRSVQPFVVELSAALDCDAGAVAPLALAVLSAAVGTSARLRVKRTWHEPAALWSVLVADSGFAKSPALRAVVGPVDVLEREANREHIRAMQEHREAEASARKSKSVPPDPPRARRYRTSDATTEAVLALLEENPRGLLVARDELSGWLGSFDRYASRGGGDIAAWIELHGGDLVKVDRKSTERRTLHVERPFAALAGTIQPTLLARAFTPEAAAAGLTPRLLLVAPPLRALGLPDEDVSAAAEDAYRATVYGLYDRPTSVSGPEAVPLSPEAWRVLQAYAEGAAARLDPLPSGYARSVLDKGKGLAARLALVVHAAENVASGVPEDEVLPAVTGETMVRACRLADWFVREAVRVSEAMGAESVAATPAARLLATLADRSEPWARADWDTAARELGKGRSTASRWLDDALASGAVTKVERGLYVCAPRALQGGTSLDWGLTARLNAQLVSGDGVKDARLPTLQASPEAAPQEPEPWNGFARGDRLLVDGVPAVVTRTSPAGLYARADDAERSAFVADVERLQKIEVTA